MIPDNNSLKSDVSNEITPEMSAEFDAAMKAATSAPETGKEGATQGHGKPPVQAGGVRAPGTRGPRIVQAGRVHRAGTVVSVGPTDIFVEFGPKELGVVPRLQWPDDKDLPVAGQEVQLVVDKHEPAENLFICSRPGSVQKADWELLEPGQVVEGRVSGVATNKEGKQVGLELEVAGHRAFMPAGQVSSDRVPDFSVFVGEKMKCMVTRVERFGKGNIVLSRREILDEERKARMDELRKTLVEGSTVEGVVRRIVDFGAFVDIGGVDGLLHMSDITYDRIFPGAKNIERYIKVNDRIRVQILKVDRDDPAAEGEQGEHAAQGEDHGHGEGGEDGGGGGKKHDRPRKSFRVSLGLKQVQGDPMSQSVVAEGADVMVKITRIAEFGAFAEITPGVEGLIHISEIDHRRINKVEDALKPNEVVQAKILKIDHANRRISLSVKALKPLPEVKIGEGGPAFGERGPGGPGGPGGGQGRGPGGGGFGGGGPRGGGGGGRGGRGERIQGRSIEEITKETPALRRAREKARNANFKGGLS
jgi:small subunit ribosomal protein S1